MKKYSYSKEVGKTCRIKFSAFSAQRKKICIKDNKLTHTAEVLFTLQHRSNSNKCPFSSFCNVMSAPGRLIAGFIINHKRAREQDG